MIKCKYHAYTFCKNNKCIEDCDWLPSLFVDYIPKMEKESFELYCKITKCNHEYFIEAMKGDFVAHFTKKENAEKFSRELGISIPVYFGKRIKFSLQQKIYVFDDKKNMFFVYVSDFKY